MILRRKTKTQVGIDLGVRSIRVSVARGGRVVSLAMYEDPRDPDPYGEDKSALTQWLSLFVREKNLQGVPAVVNAPGDRLVIFPGTLRADASRRRLVKDLSEDNTLKSYVLFDDPRFVIWDPNASSKVIGPTPVWAAALSEKLVNQRAEQVRSTGLDPLLILPDLAAVAEVSPREDVDRILMDIGEVSTQVGFVREGQLVFYRTVDLGVVSLIQPLARELDDNFYLAFRQARRHAEHVEENAAVDQIVAPIFDRLWSELRRSIEIYGERCGLNRSLALTVLGGGGLLIDREDVSRQIGLDTEPFVLCDERIDDPEIQTLDFSDEAEDLEPFAAAIGCSLADPERDDGLFFPVARQLPGFETLKRVSLSNPLAVVAVLLFATLVTHIVLSSFETSVADASAKAHESRLALERDYLDAQERQAATEELRSHSELVANARLRSALHPGAFLLLGALAVDGVEITGLSVVSPGAADGPLKVLREEAGAADFWPGFILRGEADGAEAIRHLLATLRQNRALTSVELASASEESADYGLLFEVKGVLQSIREESAR